MVWALREVPNATTGVSPYMLVYGRVPRGPLAVLKETWAGERELPPGLGKPVEEYLQDLRDKLGTAAQYAMDHARKQQAGYVGRYNLHARHKKFHEVTRLSCWPQKVVESCLISGKAPEW